MCSLHELHLMNRVVGMLEFILFVCEREREERGGG